MYLKDIVIKNFLSYGERPTRYQFDKHQMLLLTASNGKGKCVHPSTEINVYIEDSETKFYFKSFNSNYKVTVGSIFEFYRLYPSHIGKISVQTRHGYYPILAAEVTAINSVVHEIIFNDTLLKCSPDHRVMSRDGKWVHAKDLIVGQYIMNTNGLSRVEHNNILDHRMDLLDLEVEAVHEYYSNGIVSHNSSILDALTFVLYGKSFREIKKDLLINSTNKKHTVVETNLTGNNGKEILVRRGLKPAIFEIYEDGKLVDQHAQAKDYQDYLESNIIGMNFITFIQTVIISKTRYTPFMRLKSADRRSFVESILNIEILGDMAKLQQKRMTALKKEESELLIAINLSDNTLANKRSSLELTNSMIDQIKRDNASSISEDILNYTNKINECQNEIIILEGKIDNTDYTREILQFNTLSSKLIEYKHLITHTENEIKKMRGTSDTCHSCGNKVDISHIDNHIKDLNIKLISNTDFFERIKLKLIELKSIVDSSKLKDQHNSSINSDITYQRRLIRDYEQSINKLSNKVIDTSVHDIKRDNLIKEIEKTTDTLNGQYSVRDNISKDISVNNYASILLKDSGIKASIIQNRIDLINNTINRYLHTFGFFISFELDSEFNETIYIKGIDDLTYNNFSEGEKLRVDLALILTWRELSLLQSGMSCNLLFFDEITDASMDTEGVELFARALSTLKDTNIWIISHTPEKLENYVRGYIHLDKVDGFTVIQNNK